MQPLRSPRRAGEGFVSTPAFAVLVARRLRSARARLRDHRVLAFDLASATAGRSRTSRARSARSPRSSFGHVLLAAARRRASVATRSGVSSGPPSATAARRPTAASNAPVRSAAGSSMRCCASSPCRSLRHRASPGAEARSKTASDVFGWPAGRWLVGAAGLVLAGVAVYQFIRGVRHKFLDDSKTEQMPRGRQDLVHDPRHDRACGPRNRLRHGRRVPPQSRYDYKANEAIGLDGALAKLYNGAYGVVASRRRRCRSDRVRVLLARRGALPAHLAWAGRARELDDRARSRPLLRYAGTESATFWVEMSAPCEVEILGHRTSTFAIEGHHYALLLADDLEPERSRRTTSVSTACSLATGRRPPAVSRPHPRRAAARPHRLRLLPHRRPQPTELESAWPEDVQVLGIDAIWTYAKQLQRGEVDWPDACRAARRPGLRRRRVAGDTRVHQVASRQRRAAGRTGRRLRGVHAALPRVVVGAGHSLAALHRTDRDDLRRPRRARRLEHLLALGRGDAARTVVGGADHRRVHVVLGLPAHRQPLAARAGRRHDLPARASSRRRRPAAPRELAHSWDRESAASRWAYYRDFGAHACSCSTPAPRGCSRTVVARWSTTTNGTGSSSTRAAPSTI